MNLSDFPSSFFFFFLLYLTTYISLPQNLIIGFLFLFHAVGSQLVLEGVSSRSRAGISFSRQYCNVWDPAGAIFQGFDLTSCTMFPPMGLGERLTKVRWVSHGSQRIRVWIGVSILSEPLRREAYFMWAAGQVRLLPFACHLEPNVLQMITLLDSCCCF